ncbi:MAG: hypothetical protein LBQ24_00770 [Candidatus Peribacteria bacterium]|jgi:hypothetical protein|nr:hypothetical protein [Candidatus Peribacteria bacterium]
MQKLNKKASVLLWSIFLSMTVLIAFISINQQVLNNLKENSNKLISTNEYNLAPNEYIVSESENYEKI